MSVNTHIAPDVDSLCCEIVRRSYDAFNDRDVEAALGCMDPDVDWPNGLEGGYLYGHKAVHDYWVRQWHMIDPHVEPISYSNDAEGNIVVDVQLSVYDLEGNVIVEEKLQHVYLVMQGLIKRMEIRKMAPAINTPAETIHENSEVSFLERVGTAGGERIAAMAAADTATAVNATVARNAAATLGGPAGMESRVEPAA
ncbi:nuclear transport factor 2 family protein [Paraflavitalea pollutisoli]|uniref:nuclear transport factor 2 family protein n=1 Tax=Paraflavitalea pollutisoli TaxID=3034143 RepID=UPI0023ED6563|nr:nuclear transport factor 2 family protein [Paraflavitalea sp. H1-2-19X]